MSPRRISRELLRPAPSSLHTETPIVEAIQKLARSNLPALPVVDDDERLKGIFGEREFLAAVFPGYLKDLKHAGFIRRNLDASIELRESCRQEPVSVHMNTEHVDVGTDFSDVEVAEIFLHHRVLVIPVVDEGRVAGILTRADFTAELAARLNAE